MGIVDQNDAERHFKPFHNEFYDAIQLGMNEFLTIESRQRLILSDSAKAMVLNCFIRNELSKVATRRQGILTAIFNDAPNSCDFVLLGKYAFRVKKLNSRNDRAGNSKTKRVEAIESNEQNLPGMPEPPDWLVLGYMVNPPFTKILRVSLSHQDHTHVNWLVPIGVDYEQEKIALAAQALPEETPMVEVRPKKTAAGERKPKEG